MGKLASKRHAHVLMGPGDDAAVLRPPQGKALVVSQDDLAEGTHFERAWSAPEDLAGRLMAVNLSDLAAMGRVRPLGCAISSGLPGRLSKTWFDRFLKGIGRHSARYGLPVVGGNIVRSSKIFLSLCVLGAGDPKGLVRRGGARPGDVLAGVGPLGEAAAGLDLLKRKRRSRIPGWGRSLVRSFWAPVPQLRAAKTLSAVVTSMMDNSDGLARTLECMAKASRAGFDLDLGGVPVSPALRRWCQARRRPLRRHQYLGGEDYGLVFTLPERAWPRLKRRLPGVYRLGRVRKGRGIKVVGLEPGRDITRFEHFRP